MKRLERQQPPACLNQYDYRKDNWSRISKDGKTSEIWEKLTEMQGPFCAYCEIALQNDNNERHVEHFISRDKNPSRTFAWSNLFGSCNHP